MPPTKCEQMTTMDYPLTQSFERLSFGNKDHVLDAGTFTLIEEGNLPKQQAPLLLKSLMMALFIEKSLGI